MPYRIEAHLLQAGPRLRLFDVHSGTLRLQWCYRSERLLGLDERQGRDDSQCACAAQANLQALMRDLFLLACADNASLLTRSGASDACAYCDRCLSSDDAVEPVCRGTFGS